MNTGKIVYPAAPSRLSMEDWDRFLNFIRSQGYAPFDHRRGASINDFERGVVGRPATLEFLISQMILCRNLWIFGCSQGVMNEWYHMLNQMGKYGSGHFSIRVFPEFDPEWDKYYKQLSSIPIYSNLFERLRSEQKLFVLIGPRAVGKTFYTDLLIDYFDGKLARVKTNTTRFVRDNENKEDFFRVYNHIELNEFMCLKEKGGYFLEWVFYRGHYYGSSLPPIYNVMDRGQNGIFALTPPGVSEIFKLRNNFNLLVIYLRPETEGTLETNYDRRKILDLGQRKELLKEFDSFIPPAGVCYREVFISGKTEIDLPKLISAIDM